MVIIFNFNFVVARIKNVFFLPLFYVEKNERYLYSYLFCSPEVTLLSCLFDVICAEGVTTLHLT